MPELDLEVDISPIERARADVAAVALFADEKPLRGSVARADWRLCGRLSALVADGRLQGAPGEAALVTSFGGLRAPMLLVLGAGARAGFDGPALAEWIRDGVTRAMALRAGVLALPFPERVGRLSADRSAEILLGAAVQALGAGPEDVRLGLRVLVAPEEATRAAELFRRARPPSQARGVALRLPGSAAEGARPSRPAATATPPGVRS